ncbi:WD40 repeat domain-containing serine/threonine protein kinase [Rubripirellula reticaptiva]|uniref:Serine/threonine-protein kinase PrkC n=1 Tax=Rubripirellula reticaptiva TaxID=2528013 RepID=A0A5C6F5J8_9BACT|nr:WD40 repeat domain-containing serine/threonine protein kinase [Rubripirellula reticaptiva]TWU56272.1 Serine/threonine-protein kinase PrkC [Rubripirellula reticaptiva]
MTTDDTFDDSDPQLGFGQRKSFSGDSSSLNQLASAAEDFDQRLRQRGLGELSERLSHSRIAQVLRLLHAATGSSLPTRSIGQSSDSSFTMLPRQVPERIGRFVMGAKVGQGGFGVVHRAHDEVLRRDVAIKVLAKSVAGQSIENEYRLFEARAAASLNHPYLVPLYEVLDDDDHVYLVSEFCDGPTLQQYLREGGSMNPKLASEVTIKIGQAVSHAHGRGLVHRDIKPGNVMLVADTAKDSPLPFTPRLTDFGLVTNANWESDVGDQWRIGGTIIYMAPEQLMGLKGADARIADVYSLGLLLYQTLVGRLPFQSVDSVELLAEICTGDIESLPIQAPPISRDLVAICLKSIRRDLTRRYASVQDFVDDLVRWREGREVHARPRSVVERSVGVAKQSPWSSLLVFAMIVLAMSSLVYFANTNQRLRTQGKSLELALDQKATSESKAINIAYRSDLEHAFASIARNDDAEAIDRIREIERYVSDAWRDRFDFRILKAISTADWFRGESFDTRVSEIVPLSGTDLFAIVAEQNLIRVYQGSNGAMVKEIALDPKTKIYALDVSADRSLFAVGVSVPTSFSWFGPSNQVEFWPTLLGTADSNAKSKRLDVNLTGFKTTVESVAFSGDGQRLAVGTRYEPLETYDWKTNARTGVYESKSRSNDLCFETGQDLMYMPNSGEVVIRKTETGDVLNRFVPPKWRKFYRMARSGDGRWVAVSLSARGAVCLYDVNSAPENGETGLPIVLESPHGETLVVRISADGRFVVAGTSGGGIVVWDLSDVVNEQSSVEQPRDEQTNDETIQKPITVSPALYRVIHDQPITAISINDDGVIASGSEDGTVAFSYALPKPVTENAIRFDDGSIVAAMTADGRTAFVGCYDGSIWRFDVETKKQICIRKANRLRARSIAVMPRGPWGEDDWIAVGFDQGGAIIGRVPVSGVANTPVHWHDIPSKIQPGVPLDDESLVAVKIVCDESDKKICLCRGFGRIQCVRFECTPDNQEIQSIKPDVIDQTLTSVKAAYFADDQTVVTLGETIHVLKHSPESSVISKPGINFVQCLAFDRNKQLIYVGGKDGRVRMLDKNFELLKCSRPWVPLESKLHHSRVIESITLSPDGNSFLTGSDTGDVAIWDSETVRCLGTIWTGDSIGGLESMSISDDASVLLMHQCGLYKPLDSHRGALRFLNLPALTNPQTTLPSN